VGNLTDRKVRNAKAGRYGDGDGLMLIVSSTGKCSWVLRFQLGGTRRDMGLGSYPEVGLADARATAIEARKLIARGG
jgi:hypothetical protein